MASPLEAQTTKQGLLQARDKAVCLFQSIVDSKLIQPGVRESKLNDALAEIARKQFGIEKYWHKKIGYC
jgi:hypothetical protein